MKKFLLIALCIASVPAYALPTYEPFTEFATTIASNPTNLIVVSNGVPLGTNAIGSISNCIDLATGGYTAPGGEQWGLINYSGAGGNGTQGNINGLDIAVISNTTLFTQALLTNLLPATFPGMPPVGQAITNFVENPAQPPIWYVTNSGTGAGKYFPTNFCGNSAVLKFAQPVTRPASGTKTLYWSYLISIAQIGQTGAGNDGRYLGFLSSTNLNLGTNNAAYPTWQSFFDIFGTAPNSPHYFGNAVFNGSPEYLEPVGASAGKEIVNTTFSTTYNTPKFVVGELVFTTTGTGSLLDTNILWVNPATNGFGGATPVASPVVSINVSNAMTDVAGLVLIDRVGNNALGGVGTNYIANLLVGSTWSYVTGGPEFTNQPANVNLLGTGGNVSFTAAATAAAQSVAYQWYVVNGGITNVLTNSTTVPGGTATVSGAQATTLTLTGIGAGDFVNYQCVATSSGTGFTLTSAQASLVELTDPFITAQPAPVLVTTNYGSNVTFTANAATGQTSMTYGWSLNGTPLATGTRPDGCVVSVATGSIAATNVTSTLTLTGVGYEEDGNYTLSVTNNLNNTVTSQHATLTVNDPIITTQPQAYTDISVSQSATLSVTAKGTSPLYYQWYGQSQGLLAGGTASTLTISNAQQVNSDNYYVVVSNANATVQSSNAVVYVNTTNLGPFSTTAWPLDLASNAVVDYHVIDPTLNSTLSALAPSSWNNNALLAPNSGDETYSSTTLDGLQCDQATGTFWNFADPNWQRFVNVSQIDLLLLVYGNSDMYNGTNGGLPTTYSYGIVSSSPSTVNYAHTGAFPLGANNGQWNWMLLTITNLPDVNGYLTVGDPVASVGVTYGGINGGTIRLEGFTDGMALAAFALGPHGAFGSSNSVDRFAVPASCNPEPSNNLAYVDFNQGITNNLAIVNNPGLGETFTVQSGVGPTNDQRTAIQPSGIMEPVILNNYLGLPCNENLSMELCLEVYDDPALAGTQFAPYQYSTDSQNDLQTFLGTYYTLTGSGQWIKLAFDFGPANLQGVNAAPLTGGCTVLFSGSAPYIDRVELGVIRTGTNALAGQIPDASYYLNPLVTCSNGYGYYAEWYPSGGILNNATTAAGYSTTSGIGPVGDQRTAEVPNPIVMSGSASYEQFTIQNSVFGPVYQDNADIIVSVDYYDDPALGTNNDIFPNTYNTLFDGAQTIVSPQAPYGSPVYTTGTGKWLTASWELPNVSFYGSYVCRFASSAPIYISRVRFNVIRPCGNYEGIDYLQSLGASATNHQVNLTWRGQGSVQGAPAATGVYSNLLSITNTATNVYSVSPSGMTNRAEFFRIALPGYPTNLSTNGP